MNLARTVPILIASVLAVCGTAASQEPVFRDSLISSPTTLFIPSEGRSSPVDTLEQLTSERTANPSRERRSETERDEIETDRDSFTPATVIAPRGRLIVESAYSFVDNRGFAETHSFPETIVRYGLTDRVELRLGWNAEIGGSSSDITGGTGGADPFARKGKVESEYTLSYGAKFRLTDQNSWVPRSVLIVQGFTPTGGSPGTSSATSFVAAYAAGWVFPNRWQFDTSMRYGFDSENGNRFSEWSPSAVLRVPLGENFAVHVEYFGGCTTGKEENTVKHYISPGMRYLVTPDLEIGARVGWGLNEQSSRFFSNVGFGWRF